MDVDDTLVVQSGKPVAVWKTHIDAPRVIISNSMLVPHWATWDEFHKLEDKGLIMYGQMTAGSWIYIGAQGILQGTYETLAAAARQAGWEDLTGRFVLTGGCGGMSGAQPLAITMNGGVGLIVECDPDRIQKRLDTKYIDTMTTDLDEALQMVQQAVAEKRPLSIGLVANRSRRVPGVAAPWNHPRRRHRPDICSRHPEWIRSQTACHSRKRTRCARATPWNTRGVRWDAINRPLQGDGRPAGTRCDRPSTMATTSVARHWQTGTRTRSSFDGFVPKYIRPLFEEGKGPFRWAALSGDPKDIWTTDEVILKEFHLRPAPGEVDQDGP